MSTKTKTINAIVYQAAFLEANNGEVTIELTGMRKPPRGSSQQSGKHRLRIRMSISSYGVLKMAASGRQGMEKLAADAQNLADGYRRTIERLGKPV